MTLANTRNLWRFTAAICKSPTNLATAFPHGGDALGIIGDFIFTSEPNNVEVRAEEYGDCVCDYVRTSEKAVITGVLRTWDDDAISAIFPNTSNTGSSNRQLIKSQVAGAGMTKPGKLASAGSFPLLISSDAPDYNPSLLIFNAIPLIDTQMRLSSSPAVEGGLAIAFHAAPDAAGKLYHMGLLEDMTL